MGKRTFYVVAVLILMSVGGVYYGWRLLNTSEDKLGNRTVPEERHNKKQVWETATTTRAPGTVRSSILTFNDIERLSTEETFDVWREAIKNGDIDTLLLAGDSLRKRAWAGDVVGVEKIREEFDYVVPEHNQEVLTSLLGGMATPASLKALLDIAESKEGSYTAALKEVENIGRKKGHVDDNRDWDVVRTELSSVLEGELPHTLHNQLLLQAVVDGLSTLGTSSGVESILRTLDGLPLSDKLLISPLELEPGEISKLTPEELQATFIIDGLRKVSSPDAIPALAERLERDPGLSDAVSRVAGDALIAIGRPQAVEVVLQWAANAEGVKARQQAVTWFSEVYDEQSLNLLIGANNRYTFRDQEILKSIVELAEQRKMELTQF